MTLRAVQPTRLTLIAFASLALLLLLFTSSSWSQDAAKKDASMREILESEDEVERLVEEKEQSDHKSIDAQRTPLSSILGLTSAMKKQEAIQMQLRRWWLRQQARQRFGLILRAKRNYWNIFAF